MSLIEPPRNNRLPGGGSSLNSWKSTAPDPAVKNTMTLMLEEQVFLLFGYGGTMGLGSDHDQSASVRRSVE